MTTYKDITNMLSKALKCFPKGVPSSVKRDYTLVLLFFKYVSDSYEDELEHAKASYAENTVRIKRSQKYFRFMLSEAKSFSSISCEQNDSLLGQRLRENLLKLEHDNSEKLRNVLHRQKNDVLFIDASTEQFYEKGKRLNFLQEKDIEAIFTLYQERSYALLSMPFLY